MKKLAIIIFGAPGSGKSTQAELIAKKFNLIHFNTGKFLEDIVFDPKRQKEKIVQREKKLFVEGKLLTPSFVTKELKKILMRINKAGWGIVFSGSPRTLYEAQKIIPLLKKLYSKENIIFFDLKIKEKDVYQRNSARLICKICGYALLSKYVPLKNPKHCPVCAGPFYKRVLDNPEKIKIRLLEYKNRTEPIFDFVKKQGFKIHNLDGKKAPYQIFEKISLIIQKNLKNK
jgi:adenylate kinase